ncbi:F-box domain protein [Raphanus sativus]|nr:F-box domain protein [Raphanus sativus]
MQFFLQESGVEDGAISLKLANGLVKLLNNLAIFGILDVDEDQNLGLNGVNLKKIDFLIKWNDCGLIGIKIGVSMLQGPLPYMSEDWLLELLERLPEKSFCRFKSVSKQWKTMIESNYLAKKRLDRSNTKLFVLRVEMSTDRYSRTIYLENISKNHHDHNSKIIIYTYKFPHPFSTSDVGSIMGVL